MKGFLLAATFLAGTFPAAAADLPEKGQKYGPPPVVTCNWCGFYMGVHGGYGWANITPDIDITPFSDPSAKGWVIGGHAGYNWVYGNLLGGLEIDYSRSDIKEDQRDISGLGLHTKFGTLASARARFGFILGDLLLYGTGGLGLAKSEASVDFCGKTCTTIATANETHFGYVIGGGAEYQIIRNVVLRGEYLFYDFGKQSHNFSLAGGLPLVLGVKADSTVGVARGGVSIKF